MTETTTQRFKFTIPILKTSVKTIKDEKGNEVEERYLDGVASGTELDLHGDRMAPSAIESMAKSLKQHVVNLNNEHDTSWSSEIGDISQLTVSKNNDLEIKAKLNKMSTANDLWYALTEQNKKLGLSIGGYVKDYEMVKEGKGKEAKWVRLYKKIDLDHIAVTSRPAYPKAWVSNIAKSIKEEDEERMIMKIKKENKKKSRESQKRREFKDLARSIVRSIQNLEADLLLELVEKGLTFLDEKQILLIENGLNMKKEDVSLKAEEAKKANAKKSKPEDEKDETLAASENEESKEEKTEAKSLKKKKAKKSKTVKADSKKDEVTEKKSEEAGDGKDEDEKKEVVSEKKEDSKEQKSEDKTSEIKTEKTTKKVKKSKLTKMVKALSKNLELVLSGYEKLQEKVEKLEAQPAGRKTVEVKKTLGDEEVETKSVDELIKARDKKIEEVRKNSVNDPNLFAKVQRVRAEFANRISNAE